MRIPGQGFDRVRLKTARDGAADLRTCEANSFKGDLKMEPLKITIVHDPFRQTLYACSFFLPYVACGCSLSLYLIVGLEVMFSYKSR